MRQLLRGERSGLELRWQRDGKEVAEAGEEAGCRGWPHVSVGIILLDAEKVE